MVLLVVILLIISVAAVYVLSGYTAKLPIEKPAGAFRVISMNIHAGNVLDKDYTNKILESDADVIVIIEWNGTNMPLNTFMQKGYHVLIDHPRKAVHGLCVLSKVNGKATVLKSPVATPCALPVGIIRLECKNKAISLFALHAPPPVPSCKGTTNDYISAVAGWIDLGRVDSAIGVARVGDIALFAGDFNCLPFEDGISNMKKKGMKDASGGSSIFKPTWKPFSFFPYIAKIDYVLCPSELEVIADYRFDIPESDHLGVLTDIKLP